jgi:ribonuclease P protein component
MLAAARRLRHRRDIERVYKTGQYGTSQYLSVKALRRHSPETRAVVVVAKKVSKKAVVRNTLRRRLTEILSKLWGQIEAGCDIVVTVKQDASQLSPADLESELRQALTKAKVTKNV